MSLYDILGVDKKCSSDELRRQYHRLLLEYHPDKSRNSTDTNRKIRFDEIQNAYKVLSTVESRRNYDQEEERKRLHSLAHTNIDVDQLDEEYFCRCGTCFLVDQDFLLNPFECPNCSTKIEISNKTSE